MWKMQIFLPSFFVIRERKSCVRLLWSDEERLIGQRVVEHYVTGKTKAFNGFFSDACLLDKDRSWLILLLSAMTMTSRWCGSVATLTCICSIGLFYKHMPSSKQKRQRGGGWGQKLTWSGGRAIWMLCWCPSAFSSPSSTTCGCGTRSGRSR